MSTYEPGTVAIATVRGVPDIRVMRLASLWYCTRPVDGESAHILADVTDIRPLVVLDLGEDASDYAELLREILTHWPYGRTHFAGGSHHLGTLADQIEQQTKPPRIPEPGLWGVVKASVEMHGSERGRFVRDGEDRSHLWECIDWPGTYAWSDLIDPELIRDGIEATS